MEQIGIRRSLQAISEAQLVIVVLDSSHALDAQDEELLELTKDKTRIIVYNKTDISHRCEGICISAASGEIEPLMAKIHELFDGHQLVLQEPLLQNERQISLMMKAESCMRQALAAMKSKDVYKRQGLHPASYRYHCCNCRTDHAANQRKAIFQIDTK